MLAAAAPTVKLAPDTTPEATGLLPGHRPGPHALLDLGRAAPRCGRPSSDRSTRSKRSSSETSWPSGGPAAGLPGLLRDRRRGTDPDAPRGGPRRATAGPATARFTPLTALPVDLRRGHHRAGRLRERPPRRRTAGRPAASAPAAVLLPAPEVAGGFVIDDAHAEAVQKLQTILGLSIAVKASEDLNREQASDVELFQDSLPVPEPSQEGPIVVVSADCKGVPLVRSALAGLEEESTPGGHEPAPIAPSPGQGRESEQETDGGGGGRLHHRAVRPHDRRGDRRVAAEEGQEASSPSAAQTPASRPAAGQGVVVPLAGR